MTSRWQDTSTESYVDRERWGWGDPAPPEGGLVAEPLGTCYFPVDSLTREEVEQATCRGVGGDSWFPEKGTNIPAAVKRMCSECPVREACLRVGINNDEEGIWGGKGRRERQRMREARAPHWRRRLDVPA